MIETFYLVILAAVLFVLLYSPRQSCVQSLSDETVHGEPATQLLFNTRVQKDTCAELGEKKIVDQLHIWRYTLY